MPSSSSLDGNGDSVSSSGRHAGWLGKLWVVIIVVSDLFTVFLFFLSFSFAHLCLLFSAQCLQCTISR